ncbi:MAG TPA: hypothetical protein VMX97_03255 [Hyphomicrobiaceae bacterium]|nr:hypothetical protein [Hyphomicrobiaceae bacterium]
MSILKSISFDEICNRGNIRDADVQKLRKLFYDDGVISEREAEALFEINDACRVQDPSWPVFFVEAVTDYIVNDVEPEGYLTAANAEWLTARISRDGLIQTQTELELLLNILDRARWSPESLSRFTLSQIEQAVVSGAGPMRTGKHLVAGVVTDGDVEMLRRVMYAFAGDGHIAITRSEAMALFRINDATADAQNSPAWTEFFVKAIANAVMATSGYKVPSREEALRREQWLEKRGELSVGNILGGFGAALSEGGIRGILDLYKTQSAEERAIARLEQQRIEIITNEEVTGGEVDWLKEQIGRDGKLTANERALLMYLKAESPKLHPKLEPLLDRLNEAA